MGQQSMTRHSATPGQGWAEELADNDRWQDDQADGDGEAACLSRLFANHYQLVFRYALQRVNHYHLAEDLAAETFARALEKHRTGLEITIPWLLATVRNLIGNTYQRRATSRALERLLVFNLTHQDHGGQAVAGTVRGAMSRLLPCHVEVLVLTYWQGLSAAESSRVVGCSVGAYWVRLTRARAALRALLLEEPGWTAPITGPEQEAAHITTRHVVRPAWTGPSLPRSARWLPDGPASR